MIDFSSVKTIRIGDVLREYGYADEKQIEEALAYQKEHRGVRIGEALIAMGVITERQMLEALSQKLRLAMVDFRVQPVQNEAVALIPKADAERYTILGIALDGKKLTVAVNDPMNFYGIEDIRQQTGMQIEIVLAEKAALISRIDRCYADLEARKAAERVHRDEQVEVSSDGEETESETPITHLLNSLVAHAASIGASDIHIEPFEKETVVRMRVDGVITRFETIPKSTHSAFISRIKILSSLDIAEKRIPQDGHFRMNLGNVGVNIRVSTIPTVFGEKAVLRLLAMNSKIQNGETFGMAYEDYLKFCKIMRATNGLIYITGPTGSGKSTTLYMVMEELSKKYLNISTIEDPVEKNIAGVNQMQVNVPAGLTFENGLRAILRQDPDVIMLGETRDAESAEISMRAAITGHVVFSTLHTNNAVASIVRLRDMGLEPYMISSSLAGVVAQRLMRLLCPECRRLEEPTDEEREVLGDKTPEKLYHAVGCEHCNGSGYVGRIAIHEILIVDKHIREMITARSSADEIEAYAINEQKMKTLRVAATEMVLKGMTTVDELNRVAYGTD